MKKVIIGLTATLGALFFNSSAKAQTGTLRGVTQQYTNSTGGTTTTCPKNSEAVCTQATMVAEHLMQIKIFVYDRDGNLIGSNTVVVTHSATEPNVKEGVIHQVETPEGLFWGKLVSN